MRLFDKILLYRNKWIRPWASVVLKFVDILTFIASIFVVVGLLYHLGYHLTQETKDSIFQYSYYVRIVFISHILLHLLLEYKECLRRFRKFVWALGGIMLITSIPYIFPAMETKTPQLSCFLLNNILNYSVFGLFAITFLSNGIVSMLGRKTNPSLILSISFLVFILLGTIILKLPKCTITPISWIDALFTSTSSVCVTGLASLEVSQAFTTLGQIVILFLIQIGGLGVMTMTSFFAMFFMGNTSLYNQLVIKDIVSSDALGASILKTLLQVFIFTILIELTGAVLIWLSIRGEMGYNLQEEIFFSIFHSVSAFCNAGFSTLPGNLGNAMIINNQSILYIIISVLVILGGIGFPILVNFKDIISYRIKRFAVKRNINVKHQYKRHLYNLNTKIVLITTLILLVGGTFIFAALEWNNSLAGMTIGNKLIHSFFNATIPRTAGFVSVNTSNFNINTLIFVMLLMWIGGASQSTAGGIKVNTFAVSMLNLFAVIRNSSRVECFGREISYDSIRRANATIIISLTTLFISIFTLKLIEPEISLFAITFECVSALCTVGSTLNITPLLSLTSKSIIVVLMFIGRIGLLTLLMSLVKSKQNTYRYPYDNIIIN